LLRRVASHDAETAARCLGGQGVDQALAPDLAALADGDGQLLAQRIVGEEQMGSSSAGSSLRPADDRLRHAATLNTAVATILLMYFVVGFDSRLIVPGETPAAIATW
jgi:hypothetical protein